MDTKHNSGILILNVDDNDGARYVKSRILQNAGFQVAEAANGTDGLTLARQMLPALVLLDVKLPDINGIEVCRRIKADPATSHVLVLQTSAALTGRDDKIRGLEGGADNYLAAPIEADELVANVNALLRLQQTQTDLRNSEERFRQLTENIEDVFWMFAAGGDGPLGLLYVSAAYEPMWGRSRAELAREPDHWLSAVHPDDRGEVAQCWAALREGQPYEQEFRLCLGDEQRWVRDRAFLVRNAADVPYRIARISSDVTRRKEMEALLRTADDNKNDFLATLAHELRNPLSPIRSAVALMQHATPDQVEVQDKARQIITRQVDHLTRLVDDLLDVARISEGKLTLQPQLIELHAVLAPALETAAPVLETRGHALEVVVPDQPIWLYGDPVRLAQVIGNLLHNAAKFTNRHGAIRLEVSLDAGQIAGQDGPPPVQPLVRIAVHDNGIGITPYNLPRIFGMFAQGHTAQDRAHDGLGIGLSLVSTLVRMHGGSVFATSPGIDQGSTFTIELPVLEAGAELGDAAAVAEGGVAGATLAVAAGAAVDATAATVADDPAPPASDAGARAIAVNASGGLLLVDDNVDSAEIMAELLMALGQRVHVAHDATAALELARKHHPDAILLDIGMPNVDGYELARQLRADPAFSGTRLVAHTGYGSPQDRERTAAAGFDFHLVKPASLADLQSALKLG